MTVHFGWFLGAGFGVQGWGDPTYGVGYDWTQPAIYQDAVRAFEGAAFDLLVIEDGVAVHPGLEEQLAVHRRVAERLQAPLGGFPS